MRKYHNDDCAFPLYHSGYMRGKDVFFVLICSGLSGLLEEYIEKENICILNEAIIKDFYRELIMDKALAVSEETAKRAGEMSEDSKEEFGIFRGILTYTDWGLYVGSCAYDLFDAINSTKEIYKCTAVELKSGRMVLLDFLEVESAQELARIVRFSVFKIAHLDITGSKPFIEESGIKAVRPPRDEWGMIIWER